MRKQHASSSRNRVHSCVRGCLCAMLEHVKIANVPEGYYIISDRILVDHIDMPFLFTHIYSRYEIVQVPQSCCECWCAYLCACRATHNNTNEENNTKIHIMTARQRDLDATCAQPVKWQITQVIDFNRQSRCWKIDHKRGKGGRVARTSEWKLYFSHEYVYKQR